MTQDSKVMQIRANELFEEIKGIRSELLNIDKRLKGCRDKNKKYLQDKSCFWTVLHRISYADLYLEGAEYQLEYFLKHNKEENND